MAIYAAMCRYHMKTYGTTQRQIAAVSAKNHQHSVHNPYSQFRKPFTIDEVLAAPPITYPMTLPMCAPLSDGAAAAIVCNEEGLQAHRRRPRARDPGRGQRRAQLHPPPGRRTGAAASDISRHCRPTSRPASVPEDMDVAEVHDASAMGEIIQSENLGLVPFGGGGPAAERGEFTLGGRIPINTSGGLESKGHPLGATGLGQIYELVTQLRGEAGARQVEGARHAIQENGGGLVGVEEGAVVVNIFAR